MSETIVLKSFAELADALDLPDGPDEITSEPFARSPESDRSPDGDVEPLASPPPAEPAPDLAALLAELEQASAMLATVARQDRETRTLALHELEQYDAAVAALREAEQTHARAEQVRRDAEAVNAQAFADEARAAAEKIAALAADAAAAAQRVAAQRRTEAERLVAQLDLERLLAERRRQEEEAHTKAAEAERAGRLSGALAEARAALQAGRDEEAKALLGHLAKEDPDNAEVASLTEIMRRRQLAVKVSAADDALWLARRQVRHDPASAVARLEGLDVDELPEELSRQVFGAWARACARLCRERGLDTPLRYAPDPGRGAVLAREHPDAPYVVVSALGLGPGWAVGSRVGERQLRRARPLR